MPSCRNDMTTQALQTFLRSLDHGAVRQDTYDLEHLTALTPAERTMAEDALLHRARRDHDRRAILSLAALRVFRAIPLLEAIAADPASPGAVWANLALDRLGADTAGRIARDALFAPSFIARFAAVHALRDHPRPHAIDALLACLHDPAPTLRSEAYASLLAALGLTPLARAADGQPAFNAPLERIHLLIASPLESLARRGAAEAGRIVRALIDGKTPQQLDLIYRPTAPADFGDALAAALLDPATPVPVERVRAATGHDRAWAETFLVAQLAVSRPRVPAAIADLGLVWALDVLREARRATGKGDPYAAELDAAIARLAASANPDTH